MYNTFNIQRFQMKFNSKKQQTLAFLDRYSIERKDPNSDQTILRQKMTNNLVLMKTITTYSNQQFKTIVETLEAQKELKNQHLLSLIQYQHKSSLNQQGVFHTLISFFQYSSHNLLQEIQARIQQHRPFDEQQLWTLLCAVVSGMSYLQQQNVGHGCISPIDIFLTSDGFIKIVDPSIASSSPLNIQEGYYYSPQLLRSLNNSNQQVDIFKSDVFSLGMCIIHAGLLQSLEGCYNYHSNKLSINFLNKKIKLLSKHYSQDLINFLAQMLKQDPEQRPNFVQLQQYMSEIFQQESMIDSTCQKVNPNTLSQQFKFLINNKSRKNSDFSYISIKSNKNYENLKNCDIDEEDCKNEICYLPGIENDNWNVDENQQSQARFRENHKNININTYNNYLQQSVESEESSKISIKIQPPKYLSHNNCHVLMQYSTGKYSDKAQNNLLQNGSIQFKQQKKNKSNLNNSNLIKLSNKNSLYTNMQSSTEQTPKIIITQPQQFKQRVLQKKNQVNHNEQKIENIIKKEIQSKDSNKQLYTDPNLLIAMRQDMERILSKSKFLQKQNQRINVHQK